MPMPNTKAPISSEGPSGAMAPPKFGLSAATGTITSAAIAITISPPSRPPASPRVRKRRHDAVKLNSAFRKAMPRPKPPRISAAEAGWPSSSTSATRIAVAISAKARNSRSMPNVAPDLGDAIVAVVIEVALVERSGAHTELLLQVVPFGARGLNGAAGIAGPFHHRAGIEPGIVTAEQFVQHEPVGRRVVELHAVDIERAGNMAISRRGRRLLLAEEKRSRARVDQSGAAALLDRLDIGSERQDAVVDGGGEDRRRWRVRAGVERQASRFPGGEAAVEDRNIAAAGVFQRPVGTRGGAEIEHVHAGRHHDHVAVLVDAEIADQRFQLGRGRHQERHVVAGD